MGESTLYGYFSSKRDILMAMVSSHANRIDSMLEKAPTINNRESAALFVEQLLELILANTQYTWALIGEAWINDDVLNSYILDRIRRLMVLITDFIRRETQAGLVRPVDPDITARFILAAVLGVILPNLRGTAPLPTPEGRSELAKTIVSLITDGIIRSGV
jgi:AcrR family transcriptional regulator